MDTINYTGRRFRSVQNTANGEVDAQTLFEYHQEGQTVWGNYAGGDVRKGHLIATVDGDGCLDMRYHHINTRGELHTGVCRTTPEVLPDGRLRLHEKWRWTSGDLSQGESVVEELPG